MKKYLFIYFVVLLYAFIFQFDMRLNGFSDGFLNSDDRRYFEEAVKGDFKNKNTKNIFYYYYNEFIFDIFKVYDSTPIILINTLVFCAALTFYIKSHNLIPSKYFIFIFLFSPIFLINSINYKDSLLLSFVLLLFSIIKVLSIKKPFYIILILLTIVPIESLRPGTSILIIFSISVCHFMNKYKNIKNFLLSLYLLSFSIFIIFTFQYIVNLEIFGNRNITNYWNNFDRYIINFTSIPHIDILFTGIIKTVLQFNLYTCYTWLSAYGEHGYNGLFLVFTYSFYILMYPVFILIAARKILSKDIIDPFFLFVLNIVLIYSFIYGGLIGLRLSYIYTFTILIFVCFKQNIYPIYKFKNKFI